MRFGHEGHRFDSAERAHLAGIVTDVVGHIEKKMDTKHGMGAEHFDEAMKFLNKDHEGWKKLPDPQKRAFEAHLKERFGIEN